MAVPFVQQIPGMQVCPSVIHTCNVKCKNKYLVTQASVREVLWHSMNRMPLRKVSFLNMFSGI
jgi:hypothetical protein